MEREAGCEAGRRRGAVASRWSGVARLGPAVCAVHCLTTPLVVGFAPWLAPTPAAELVLALLTLGVAAWIVRGDVRHHGRRSVVALLVLAAAAWLATLAWAPPALEPLLAPACAAATAGLLLLSARLRCAH